MRDERASSPSIAYLWLEVATTKVLMWMANPTGLCNFQPHVHLYLADRYGRLAMAHRLRLRFVDADRLAKLAELHFYLGGGDEPPPAAALAVGSHRRQVLVDSAADQEPLRNAAKILPFAPKKPSSAATMRIE